MAIIPKKVSEFPVATDPAQFDIFGQDRTTGQSAKAEMSLLKGDTGPAPNISVTMATLPYGSTPTVTKGGTDTAPIFEIGFPLAQDGRTAMFQKNGTLIQYRYDVSESWVTLYDLSDYRFTFEDFTPDQIAELQAPAIDAADNANVAADDAINAAQEARDAAAAAEDGKTPVMQAGTATDLDEGQPPTVELIETGTDPSSGAPIYSLNLGIPKGDRGFTPQIRGGQLDVGAPNSVPVLVFTQTGVDASGVPIYSVSGTLPKGDPGSGNGNVEVAADGLITGKQYAFVPNEDGSPIGTFQEIEIPNQQVQSDYGQEDDTQPDYIKRKPNLAPVATSGSYNDLADKPQLTSGIWKDVTDMFDIPTQADVKCLMVDDGINKPMIVIHGVDTSGETNSLTITAAHGFGSYYERIDNDSIVIRGQADGEVVDHLIQVTAESEAIQTSIAIPAACNYFTIQYFVGQTTTRLKSYYETTSGIIKAFSAEDTPIENFCDISGDADRVTINGENIRKEDIRKLSFGEGYRATTTLPDYFLYIFHSLEYVDISVFTNVDTIGVYCMTNCPFRALDVTSLANVRTIGFCFMYWGSSSPSNSGILDLDLTPMINMESIGDGFLFNRTLNSLKLPVFTMTEAPNEFLSGIQLFSPLDLSPCAAFTSADGFMKSIRIVGYPIDTSPLVNLQYLGNSAFYYCKTIDVDLSGLISLVSVGDHFFFYASLVKSIQLGNVDWSGIDVSSVSRMLYISANGTLYADSAYIAQAFKTKMNSKVLNTWTVVINPTE